MSYCELKIIKNNKVETHKEYRNSHGGAAFIWSAVYDRFAKDPNIEYDSWLMNSDKLWPLWKDERLPRYMQLVLGSTYDRVIIKFENLVEMSEYFIQFVQEFGMNRKVCHLLEWAGELTKIASTETAESCQGVCFYQTSVSEDPWEYAKTITDDDGDEDYEYFDYDLTKGDKHWFLYECHSEVDE